MMQEAVAIWMLGFVAYAAALYFTALRVAAQGTPPPKYGSVAMVALAACWPVLGIVYAIGLVRSAVRRGGKR